MNQYAPHAPISPDRQSSNLSHLMLAPEPGIDKESGMLSDTWDSAVKGVVNSIGGRAIRSAGNLAYDFAVKPIPPVATLNILKRKARVSELVNNIRWERATMAGLLGIGVGATARGLGDLMKKEDPDKETTTPSTSPDIADMPFERKEKRSEDSSGFDFDSYTGEKAPTSFWGGANANSWWSHPLALSTVGLTSLTGLYGGWKGVDMYLDKKRKDKERKSLEEAKRMFEDAISHGSKKAADRHLQSPRRPGVRSDLGFRMGAALNQVFDSVTKTGFDEFSSSSLTGLNAEAEKVAKEKDWTDHKDTTLKNPLMGTAANLYSVYAIMSGLASGYYAYNLADKMSYKNTVESAKRIRRDDLDRKRPTPVHVRPVEREEKGGRGDRGGEPSFMQRISRIGHGSQPGDRNTKKDNERDIEDAEFFLVDSK